MGAGVGEMTGMDPGLDECRTCHEEAEEPCKCTKNAS